MRILKISAPFISSPLYCIINTSLNSGVFPTRLKHSIITPLHKKGDKNNVAYNRPISLLMSFPKIFEKIIHNGVISHPIIFLQTVNLVSERRNQEIKLLIN